MTTDEDPRAANSGAHDKAMAGDSSQTTLPAKRRKRGLTALLTEAADYFWVVVR